MKRSMLSAAILGALGLGSTYTALAINQTVDLCAGAYDKTLATLPATQVPIPMWGYALGQMQSDGNGGFECVTTPTSPGPRISIDDAYDGLTIHLHNALPRTTSLVIPGTVKGMTPQTFTAPDNSIRVFSFDIDVDSGLSETYHWNNLKPGSYMYHSGTHPQVQVQMGLYGAVTDNVSTNPGFFGGGVAYPGVPFGQDVVLFYSEIDRAIHDSVAAGFHNTGDMLSTIDYAPKHFLIDVDTGFGPITYEFNDLAALKFPPNFNPLVRFFNAGLETHVPTVFEASFDVIAEDAKLYPNVRKQYTVKLPPLKTKDAFMNVTGTFEMGGPPSPFPNPFAWRTFRLTDSAMAVSAPAAFGTGPVVSLAESDEIANGTDNGMVLHIQVAASDDYVEPVLSGDEPKANRDNFDVAEGQAINDIIAQALSNDQNASGATVAILSHPKHGDLIDNGGGNFTYQHNGAEKAADSMMYSITNAAGETSSAGIKIEVIPVNDAPVAHDDTASAKVGQVVEIRPVANDTDADSPGLSVSAVGDSDLGTLEISGQVIIFTASTVGNGSVSYTVDDGKGGTDSANISLTVTEATGGGPYTPPGGGGEGGEGGGGNGGVVPEAEDDRYTVVEGSVLDNTGNTILGVMANDTFGAKVNTSLIEYPEHGTIVMAEDGTFVYTHDGLSEEDDHFKYEIYNETGSAKADVEIKIAPRPDAPHVNNDRAKTKVGESVMIDVLRNDKDRDSALDPTKLVITKQPANGSVEIVTEGYVRYTPNSGFTGKDFFRYRLGDSVTGELSKRSAKVKVRVK